jgi:hypothetical protein
MAITVIHILSSLNILPFRKDYSFWIEIDYMCHFVLREFLLWHRKLQQFPVWHSKFRYALRDTASKFHASYDTAVSFTGNKVTFDEEKTKIPLCGITQGIIPSYGFMYATNMLMID